MLKRDENSSKIVLEMEFVWSAAQKLFKQSALIVTIPKDNYACVKTEKYDQLVNLHYKS